MREFLTTRQAASRLQLNPDSLRRLVREGKIKAVRIGGQLRFNLDDLTEHLDSKAAA